MPTRSFKKTKIVELTTTTSLSTILYIYFFVVKIFLNIFISTKMYKRTDFNSLLFTNDIGLQEVKYYLSFILYGMKIKSYVFYITYPFNKLVGYLLFKDTLAHNWTVPSVLKVDAVILMIALGIFIVTLYSLTLRPTICTSPRIVCLKKNLSRDFGYFISIINLCNIYNTRI